LGNLKKTVFVGLILLFDYSEFYEIDSEIVFICLNFNNIFECEIENRDI